MSVAHGFIVPWFSRAQPPLLRRVEASPYRKVLADVGQRIRAARIQAGLTQEDAAHAANIDWRRWQRIEEGTVNVTLKTLVRVARAVQTDFWGLVSRELRAAPPVPKKRRPSRRA